MPGDTPFDAALAARVAKLEAEQSEARNRAARLEAALGEVSRTASAHHAHEDSAVLLHALLVEIPELARAALEDKS